MKKAKNPKFMRQDSYKKKRITLSWRKPRGWDSKQRRRMQRQAIVEPGYGSPAVLRGVHRSGLEIAKISQLKALQAVNPKTHGIVLSGKIGFKTRLVLITEAKKLGIRILNIPKPDEYTKKKEEKRVNARKHKEEKAKKHKEEVKKVDKESIEDKLSDEEKKKLEKKEIDRLLTKKFQQ
jgi:large subunit ribosomal protein L32e